MAFLKLDIKKETVKENVSKNSGFITESGIYEVILKNVFVDVTKNGSKHLNFFIERDGVQQTIYQAIRLFNTDGSPNFQYPLFEKLCVVAGADTESEIADPISMKLPIGSGGAEKECMVLEEFTDIPIYIRIQNEYSIYQGKPQEQKRVKNFFSVPDKASASEILEGTEKGKQFAIEEEYAGNNYYKDGTTPESIQAWINERRNARNSKENVERESPTNTKTNRFGKRK